MWVGRLLLVGMGGLVTGWMLWGMTGEAAVVGCSATATPVTMTTSTTLSVAFSITNTDPDNSYDWIKITRPSSEFTLGTFTPSGEWEVSGTTNDAIFLDSGLVDPDETVDFSVLVTSGSNEVATQNWTIEVSDASGDSPFTCTGTLGLAIAGANAGSAPTISNVASGSVGSSSATITWETDEAATSVVEYGTSESYGSTQSSATLVTGHSVTLGGLSASTLYYYRVKSVDIDSNETVSAQNQFTTSAAASSSASETTTTTVIKTITVTASPTPSPSPSPSPSPTPSPTPTPTLNAVPQVVVLSDLSEAFEEAPEVTGRATDAGSITRVQYSTDGGRNWLPVDVVEGLGTGTVSFSFVPTGLGDDSYQVVVRAFDDAGAAGLSPSRTLVIDQIPPQFGTGMLLHGAQAADGSGVVSGVAGLGYRLVLGAVGGPETVLVTARNVTRGGEQAAVELERDYETGLWSGEVVFDEAGVYEVTAQAVDGAGNETREVVRRVAVTPRGQVRAAGQAVVGSRVTVMMLDEASGRFRQWDGRGLGQTNPQMAEEGYSVLLGPGTYYMTVEAPGYELVTTRIFTLTERQSVSQDFELEMGRGWWPWRWGKQGVTVTVEEQEEIVQSRLVGQELPQLEVLAGVRGQVRLVTLVNDWMPRVGHQLRELEAVAAAGGGGAEQVLVVVDQMSEAAVGAWKRRGAYGFTMRADVVGAVAGALELRQVPSHVVLDQRGVVQRVVTGVLEAAEIIELLGGL